MNDHLRADLASGADTFDLPPGDLGAVVQRARRRSRRRHQVTATIAAVAVVATTVAAIRAAGPDAPRTRLAANGPSAARLGDSGIEWSAASTPGTAISAWAYQGTAELDGRTYALSTAPGQHEGDTALPRVLWRSADGIEWEQAAGPTSFSPSRLAAGDGRLYAIGTGPATLHVGWADAGHGAWQDETLPIDTASWADKTTAARIVPVDVAAAGGTVVAAAAVGVDLDVPALLPAGEATPHGWYVGADGIDVLGDGPECPAGTSPDNPDPKVQEKLRQAKLAGSGAIADADAAKAAKAATLAGAPATTTGPGSAGQQYESYCWSPDGTGRSVPPTAGRGVVAHHPWAEVGIAGDLLRAVRGEPFVFRGDDAGGFERVDLGGRTGTAEVEATDDGFVLALAPRPEPGTGKVPSRQVVLRSSDGRTWRTDGDLPDMDGVLATGIVDGHLAIIGSGPEGGTYAELRPEGWRTTSLGTLLGAAKGGWITAAAIGPLGVVAGIGESKGDVSSTSIVASRDGVTWSRTAVDDLIGGPGDVARIVIKDDRAVVTAVRYAEGTKAQQVAVVGTPR